MLEATTELRRKPSEVGPGDYVKVGLYFRKIAENPVQGKRTLPRHWKIVDSEGKIHGCLAITRYLKAEDVRIRVEKQKKNYYNSPQKS